LGLTHFQSVRIWSHLAFQYQLLAFESRLKLTEIRGFAVGHYIALKSIFLPAALSVIDSSAFIRSLIIQSQGPVVSNGGSL
jgi:hypothetical protein